MNETQAEMMAEKLRETAGQIEEKPHLVDSVEYDLEDYGRSVSFYLEWSDDAEVLLYSER